MKISPARVWRERDARYRLIGSKCLVCGKAFYPPKPSCPYCGSRETTRIELPKKGKVISWSVEYTVPEGYRSRAPIIAALIELENGVKVLSTLADVEPNEVYIGMEVEAVLRRIWEESNENLIIYGIKFVPIKQ